METAGGKMQVGAELEFGEDRNITNEPEHGAFSTLIPKHYYSEDSSEDEGDDPARTFSGTSPDYVCCVCGSRFKHLEYLIRHFSVHKSEVRCHLCQVTFSRAISLALHLEHSHARDQLVCKMCRVTCHNVWHINEHLEKHSVQHIASVKKKNTVASLLQKKKQEEEEKEEQDSENEYMQRINLKEKEYLVVVRNVEEKNTVTLTSEEEHLLKKRTTQTPVCPNCFKMFSNRDALKKHSCSRQASVPELSSSEELQICTSCGFRKAPGTENTAEICNCITSCTCIRCGVEYESVDLLQKHLAEKHSSIVRICPRCFKMFDSPDAFLKHLCPTNSDQGGNVAIFMPPTGVEESSNRHQIDHNYFCTSKPPNLRRSERLERQQKQNSTVMDTTDSDTNTSRPAGRAYNFTVGTELFSNNSEPDVSPWEKVEGVDWQALGEDDQTSTGQSVFKAANVNVKMPAKLEIKTDDSLSYSNTLDPAQLELSIKIKKEEDESWEWEGGHEESAWEVQEVVIKKEEEEQNEEEESIQNNDQEYRVPLTQNYTDGACTDYNGETSENSLRKLCVKRKRLWTKSIPKGKRKKTNQKLSDPSKVMAAPEPNSFINLQIGLRKGLGLRRLGEALSKEKTAEPCSCTTSYTCTNCGTVCKTKNLLQRHQAEKPPSIICSDGLKVLHPRDSFMKHVCSNKLSSVLPGKTTPGLGVNSNSKNQVPMTLSFKPSTAVGESSKQPQTGDNGQNIQPPTILGSSNFLSIVKAVQNIGATTNSASKMLSNVVPLISNKGAMTPVCSITPSKTGQGQVLTPTDNNMVTFTLPNANAGPCKIPQGTGQGQILANTKTVTLTLPKANVHPPKVPQSTAQGQILIPTETNMVTLTPPKTNVSPPNVPQSTGQGQMLTTANTKMVTLTLPKASVQPSKVSQSIGQGQILTTANNNMVNLTLPKVNVEPIKIPQCTGQGRIITPTNTNMVNLTLPKAIVEPTKVLQSTGQGQNLTPTNPNMVTFTLPKANVKQPKKSQSTGQWQIFIPTETNMVTLTVPKAKLNPHKVPQSSGQGQILIPTETNMVTLTVPKANVNPPKVPLSTGQAQIITPTKTKMVTLTLPKVNVESLKTQPITERGQIVTPSNTNMVTLTLPKANVNPPKVPQSSGQGQILIPTETNMMTVNLPKANVQPPKISHSTLLRLHQLGPTTVQPVHPGVRSSEPPTLTSNSSTTSNAASSQQSKVTLRIPAYPSATSKVSVSFSPTPVFSAPSSTMSANGVRMLPPKSQTPTGNFKSFQVLFPESASTTNTKTCTTTTAMVSSSLVQADVPVLPNVYLSRSSDSSPAAPQGLPSPSVGPLKIVGMFVNQSQQLALQRRMHQNWQTKPIFQCHQCGTISRQPSLAVRHRYQHRGPRPHVCQCGRAFQRRLYLLRHQVQNAEDMCYVCATCGRTFKGMHRLAQHKQNTFCKVEANGGKIQTVNKCRNLFPCHCGQVFAKPAALLWHMLKNSSKTSCRHLNCHSRSSRTLKVEPDLQEKDVTALSCT